MKGRQFIRMVRKLGRNNGVDVTFTTQGKGSHGTLHYGDRKTTVKDRSKELGPGLFGAMCNQLDIDPADL